MCLASYLDDEDALVADFAEYYHVYDWTTLPIKTAATLAAQLRPSSRSYMHREGVHVNTTNALLADIYDELQVLICSRPYLKKKIKPNFIAEELINGPKKKDDIKAFKNEDDFKKAWEVINGR